MVEAGDWCHTDVGVTQGVVLASAPGSIHIVMKLPGADFVSYVWRLVTVYQGLQGAAGEYGPLLVENLDPLACGFHHKDPPLIIHIYCYRSLEQSLSFP